MSLPADSVRTNVTKGLVFARTSPLFPRSSSLGSHPRRPVREGRLIFSSLGSRNVHRRLRLVPSLAFSGLLALVLTSAAEADSFHSETAPATSTTTSSSSSTHPQDAFCTIEYRLYDPIEMTSLTSLMFTPGVSCTSSIPGVEVNTTDSGFVVQGFPAGFQGPATFLTCTTTVHHSICPRRLEDLTVWVLKEAEGPTGPLSESPTVCPERLTCDHPCEIDDAAAMCGDADGSGAIRARDALLVLRSAVGLEECLATVCDVDRDSGVNSKDALTVLLVAIGLDRPLICPAPCAMPSP